MANKSSSVSNAHLYFMFRTIGDDYPPNTYFLVEAREEHGDCLAWECEMVKRVHIDGEAEDNRNVYYPRKRWVTPIFYQTIADRLVRIET